MARIEGGIVIGRHVGVVFDYVADQSNGPVVTWLGIRQEQRIWAALKQHLESTPTGPAKTAAVPAAPDMQ